MRNNLLHPRMLLRIAGLTILAGLFVWATIALSPVETLRSIDDVSYISALVVFFGLMVLVTVAAPLAILPAVPAVALILDPLPTALVSVAGWTTGAVIAFCIARYLGRPIVGKFVSLKRMARYERIVPEEMTFWGLVVLRMLVPVDLLSYVIGIITTMRLGTYTLATAIGVVPFSFIFAYAGYAATTGDYTVVIIAGGVVVVALVFAYRTARRYWNVVAQQDR